MGVAEASVPGCWASRLRTFGCSRLGQWVSVLIGHGGKKGGKKGQKAVKGRTRGYKGARGGQ